MSLAVCEYRQRLFAGRDDGSIVSWDIPAELFLPTASDSSISTRSLTNPDTCKSCDLLQLVDLFFQVLDERVKLCNVGGVVALFVFSEAEQVGDVLRTPAMEIEFVLFHDQASHVFILNTVRPGCFCWHI